MTATIPIGEKTQFRFGRLVAAGLLTIVFLAVVTMTYFYLYRDDCSIVASWKYCEFAKHLGERCIAVLVIFGIYVYGRADTLPDLRDAAVGPGAIRTPALLIGAGAALVVVPALIVGIDAAGTALLAAITAWTFGALLVPAGILRLVAPWGVWWRTMTSGGLLLPGILLVGLFLPELGDTLFPLWHVDLIRNPTFDAVVWMSHLIGLELLQDASTYVVGQGDFFVEIGQSCSGIEGFILISVFLIFYAAIFNRQVFVGRVLAMLPLALALSWVLNIVRISVLIWLGVNVSPTLAVEGFHSHAGWLMFSLLSLGLITAINVLPWFQRTTSNTVASAPAQPLPPLSDDWNVARILPFATFMFSALLVSTFSQTPGVLYPFRMMAVAAALWFVWPQLQRLAWRFDPLSALTGLGIGVYWIATGPAASGPPPFAELSGLMLILWIIARVIGTSVIIPIIEELMFRDYLLTRIAPKGATAIRVVIAVAVSSALFAVLHDRWIAALVAGLIFSALMLRSRNITDAILSHGVANFAIALWAVVTGAWHII